ncbi:hypothetical protein HAT2_00700 [Candidatus Similichlamydia laticola]|uniref:Uncharacterized protein n=2 Tax=Candidatus Similichlamydia laticola TaxID=2170265 RepID=A0A369KCN6_9BACT|nr:hypothetical protein HAT2_00700 [Candidatus Similichlamydia laticola]
MQTVPCQANRFTSLLKKGYCIIPVRVLRFPLIYFQASKTYLESRLKEKETTDRPYLSRMQTGTFFLLAPLLQAVFFLKILQTALYVGHLFVPTKRTLLALGTLSFASKTFWGSTILFSLFLIFSVFIQLYQALTLPRSKLTRDVLTFHRFPPLIEANLFAYALLSQINQILWSSCQSSIRSFSHLHLLHLLATPVSHALVHFSIALMVLFFVLHFFTHKENKLDVLHCLFNSTSLLHLLKLMLTKTFDFSLLKQILASILIWKVPSKKKTTVSARLTAIPCPNTFEAML